jgi:outer membrane receptor protein involved in Fe transport
MMETFRLGCLLYILVVKVEHFRGSFQTGFRNPTTQDQYIGFNVGSAILLGSNPDNLTRYSEVVGTPVGQAFAGGQTVTINGLNAYNNSYTATSVAHFQHLKSCIEKNQRGYVKPEQVKAFELGYRSFIEGFSVDVNGYYNIYNDFIGNLNVVAHMVPQDSQVVFQALTLDFSLFMLSANSNFRAFQLYTNTKVEISHLVLV